MEQGDFTKPVRQHPIDALQQNAVDIAFRGAMGLAVLWTVLHHGLPWICIIAFVFLVVLEYLVWREADAKRGILFFSALSASLAGALIDQWFIVSLLGLSFLLSISDRRTVSAAGLVAFVAILLVQYVSPNGGAVLGAVVFIALGRLRTATHVARQAQAQYFAHDFRTPVANAYKSIDALLSGQEGTLSPAVKKRLQEVSANVQTVSRKVDNFIDWLRTENSAESAVGLDPSEIDVVERISYAVRQFETSAETAHITISCLFMTGVSKVVIANNVLLSGLVNLLSNAVKHANPQRSKEGGSIRILVSSENLVEQNYLVVTVTDSGKGVPDEVAKHLFRKPVSISLNSELRSTGLGLMGTWRLARLAGGALQLAPKNENSGATFVFSLPYTPVSDVRFTSARVMVSILVDETHASVPPPSRIGFPENIDFSITTIDRVLPTSDPNKRTVWVVDSKRITVPLLAIPKRLLAAGVNGGVVLWHRDGDGQRGTMSTQLGQRLCDAGYVCLIQGGADTSLFSHAIDVAAAFTPKRSTTLPLAPLSLKMPFGAQKLNRILVAEDHAEMSHHLQTVFSRAGYEVVAVRSGQVALARLAREQFDLLFLDFDLGDMTAMSLLDQSGLLQERRLSAPVIIFTAALPVGLTSASLMERGYANEVVDKYTDDLQLLAVIERYMPRAPRSSQIAIQTSEGGVNAPLYDDLSSQLSQIQQALIRGDWSAATAAIHRMRGVAGVLKEKDLHAVTGKWKNGSPRPDNLEPIYTELAAEVSRITARRASGAHDTGTSATNIVE